MYTLRRVVAVCDTYKSGSVTDHQNSNTIDWVISTVWSNSFYQRKRKNEPIYSESSFAIWLCVRPCNLALLWGVQSPYFSFQKCNKKNDWLFTLPKVVAIVKLVFLLVIVALTGIARTETWIRIISTHHGPMMLKTSRRYRELEITYELVCNLFVFSATE